MYDYKKLTNLLEAVLSEHLNTDAWQWLKEKASHPPSFNATFASLPRKTGKTVIDFTEPQVQELQSIIPGFSIQGWTVDRLARVWLLMQVDHSNPEKYFKLIENLFLAAEMNELVALYAALPVLAYPEMWKKRCAEGIRSNIANVLEAIMYENPYPATYLPEAAWNQLVLKAFFTEKSINRIYGLDQRANPELANILSDYAHERWAAHRTVNPQLWRCVAKHLHARLLPDIEKLITSGTDIEKQAAALSCYENELPQAKELLRKLPDENLAIEKGALTWDTLAAKSALN